ncbi:MAG: flagellar hook-length control protein FliK [Nitrosomonas sp.]|nr:MAG: flagellar hook-length control protein FliK [Nitrosomonas sp.]
MPPTTTPTDLITHLIQSKLVTPITAILDSQNPSVSFEQGEKYQALVEARLSNGNAKVLIAAKLIQIPLPDNFQVGNKVEVIFITHEPHLKFLIASKASLETNINHTSISTTGRFLGMLMQSALNQSLSQTFQSTTSSSPIISNEILINRSELPSLLQKAISQSGLFYESHLAQWIYGANTLENLQNEPQNKLMPAAEVTKTTKSIPQYADISISTHNMPILLQQLTTLETGHLYWQGEVWKNQQMEWDIFEQVDDTDKSDFNHAIYWQTQIRLSMPHLGNITAKISLNLNNIKINIDVSEYETASLLKNNQLPFASNMQSAGLTIQSLEVQSDDNE